AALEQLVGNTQARYQLVAFPPPAVASGPDHLDQDIPGCTKARALVALAGQAQGRPIGVPGGTWIFHERVMKRRPVPPHTRQPGFWPWQAGQERATFRLILRLVPVITCDRGTRTNVLALSAWG